MLKLEEILKPAMDKPETATREAAPAPRRKAEPRAATGQPAPAPAPKPTPEPTPEAPAKPAAPPFDPAVAATAEREARAAHAEQTDKAGRPYEEHLKRVAGAFSDPGDITVAWLHDTLEDTALTAGELVHRGIPKTLVEDLETLTPQGVERYGGYIERVGTSGSPRAIAVKAADIRDRLETNPKAVGADDKRRYRHALKRLRHHAKRRGMPTPAPA